MVQLRRAFRRSELSSSKRGVLLLVVLSMLTLFLMLGATYVVVAMRARKVARAFARRTSSQAVSGGSSDRLVDQAFLIVARGTLDTTIPHVSTGDDLLGDKYGTRTLTGTISSLNQYQGSSALLALSTSSIPAADMHTLPGRVLTLTLPGLTASVRILGTRPGVIIIPAGRTASGTTISYELVVSAVSKALKRTGTDFIINGREFDDSGTNEPYDGFDAKNPLLSKVVPISTDDNGNTSISTTVTQSPLNGTGTLDLTTDPLVVDNDGDGIADSRFIDLGLPSFTASNGMVITPRAAIHVMDLDGRINLNVHDALSDADAYNAELNNGNGDIAQPDAISTSGTYLWGTGAQYLGSLPVGLAGTPAGISIRKGYDFDNGLQTNQGASPQQTTIVKTARAAGGMTIASQTQTSDRLLNRRKLPSLSRAEGRYGATNWEPDLSATIDSTTLPRPGIIGRNDPSTKDMEQWDIRLNENANNRAFSFFNPSYASRYGTPPDLKGRMRIWADPQTGQPVYYKPYWDQTQRSNASDNEAVDDPYEANLTRSGSQVASTENEATGGDKIDNPFTPADLETLLRLYDPDSLRLSRRLEAILDGAASDARLRLTTESWDTTAIVGTAWKDVIADQFQAILNTGNAANDSLAPETIAGLRMDMNRPFHTQPDPANNDDVEENDSVGTDKRQQFARHIFSILVGVALENGTTLDATIMENLAQYAVNIVDFRDADSIMTRFEFDPDWRPNITAWDPSKTVWGCERPELLITETFAWHDRRTDDLPVGGHMEGEKDDPANPTPADAADDDFDQERPPVGAFFVELTVPPASKAMQFDGSGVVAVQDADNNDLRGDPLPMELVATEDTNNNNTLANGEDTNSNGQIDADPSRLLTTTTIQLDKVVPHATASNRSPVWRLAAVRGDEAFGADPTGFVTSNTDKTILDPSRSGGPDVERAFYFAEPTPQLKASPTGDLSKNDVNDPPASDGVFWLSSAPNSPLSSQTVVGSARPFDCSDTDSAPDGDVLTFEDENNLQGTLTIPTTKHDSDTPYDVLAEGVFNAPLTAGPIDKPLDSLSQTDFDNAADITSKALLDANDKPILMQNGTHENFAVIHLQRLANPTKPWHPTTNPYITVDSMPVDLAVVNFSNNGAGLCYDEPGYSGGNPLAYLNQQKDFGRDNVLTAESVERGGKDEMDDTQEDNLWNSRVDPAKTDLHDGEAMRSKEDIAARAPATQQPDDPTVDPIVLTPTSPLAPTHTFADPPARSPDPTASPSEGPELPWFFFPNRPFANSVELSLVPTSSPFNLLKHYSVETDLTPKIAHLPGFWEDETPPAPWDAITGRSDAGGAGDTNGGTSSGGDIMSLLDFVHVPSRFAGLATTIPNVGANTGALQALGLDELAYGHVSHVREPGRINVNTIIDGEDTDGEAAGAWRALLGSGDYAGDIDVQTTTGLDQAPQWTEALFQTPSTGFLDTIRNKVPSPKATWRDDWAPQNAGDPIGPHLHRHTNRNPYFRYSTISQLADRVTTRSNVFAVWVTIGFFEENADQSVGNEITPIKRLRGFYLFDRSIPVAYQQGRDNNISDAILLRRIIE